MKKTIQRKNNNNNVDKKKKTNPKTNQKNSN